MRRIKWIAAIVVGVSVLLAGCGAKDAESVVKDLSKSVSDMESYQGKGTMTLHTGQEPLQYQVEVWYQKPEYYRIALTNTQKDITQIVLRNDDGVFVLTPRLNKSFRFQSDWPENQGQVYLYQTLVQSIVLDNSRQFVAEKDAYVFDVMANYQNGSLARQKIWLDKKAYAPRQVQVSDANGAVMVEVKFDEFSFDPKFGKDAFDMQRNMSAAGQQQSGEQPADSAGDASAEPTPSGSETGSETGSESAPGTPPAESNSETGATAGDADEAQATGAEAQEDEAAAAGESAAEQDIFVTMEPGYLPDGVALKDWNNITYGGNDGMMLRYTGDYDYTLIQTRPQDRAASIVSGDMVDLGHTLGLMSGEEQRTLTWTYEGVEFRLSSKNLPETEMIKVAGSVMHEMGK
ncbi:DUF4367 domain-containing protein [Paenibacillus sp. IB182496]|uniref:DUF4367 domain-containing protein n=1 Tax=Paenibacillus sabuli TaxID=2772509 RepID=A0A927BXM9_9BACL|nr:outer membrane lipoprotein-sorting protein [Paenibacillus sabuli]MBD2847791.1 DUF4367 domain-containing protein [Paenibacillus sabuli]